MGLAGNQLEVLPQHGYVYCMHLARVTIENFRGIESLEIHLEETTLLIGENNTGKSSVLEALNYCLSRTPGRRSNPFTEYDYRLGGEVTEPSAAPPIRITLYFEERTTGEWSAPLMRKLGGLDGPVTIGADDRQRIALRLTSGFSEATGDLESTWEFLNPQGDAIARAQKPSNFSALQQLAPVFYLSALRDAAAEFRPRSQFWAPFVRSFTMDEGVRTELEGELAALNQRILDTHTAFEPIRQRLRNSAQYVPLSATDPVVIEAIPAKVFDVLSRTQVLLTGRTGAQLPIGRHGEGTQSVAVICLFDAFLEAQLASEYDPESVPILALEEPEAHLHPSAVRSIGSLLQSLAGQKLISTHSGDLVGSAPIRAIRRLSRRGGRIFVNQIDPATFTQDDLRKIDHHVRLTRGNHLFARLWLLVEGETDVLVAQECARLKGRDLFNEGVVCVEFAQVGLAPLVRLADQLGIDWFVLVDGDDSGNDYIRTATGALNGRPAADHMAQYPAVTIERFLSDEGFAAVYIANIAAQKAASVVAAVGTDDYWKQVFRAQSRTSKPALASQVIEMMEGSTPPNVPALYHEVLDRVIARAEAAQ